MGEEDGTLRLEAFVARVQWAGTRQQVETECEPGCAPHPIRPPGGSQGPSPLLRTPERRLGSLEADSPLAHRQA